MSLSIGDLLAAIANLENATTADLLNLCIYSDGSGYLETMQHEDVFVFESIQELLEKIKTANGTDPQFVGRYQELECE